VSYCLAGVAAREAGPKIQVTTRDHFATLDGGSGRPVDWVGSLVAGPAQLNGLGAKPLALFGQLFASAPGPRAAPLSRRRRLRPPKLLLEALQAQQSPRNKPMRRTCSCRPELETMGAQFELASRTQLRCSNCSPSAQAANSNSLAGKSKLLYSKTTIMGARRAKWSRSI